MSEETDARVEAVVHYLEMSARASYETEMNAPPDPDKTTPAPFQWPVIRQGGGEL